MEVELQLPSGLSLFLAVLPGIISERPSVTGGNPGLPKGRDLKNSETPAVLSLFSAVFAARDAGSRPRLDTRHNARSQ